MIKNIIFDLGNVLIDIDFPRSEQLLDVLVGGNVQEKLGYIGQKNLFLQYEVGEVSEAEFIEILWSMSEKEVTRAQIKAAWNGMLIGFKAARFEMLERLAKKYTLYVLSNTNATHIEWVHQDLLTNHGITDYEKRFFTKVYYSHEVRKRKPNVDIYEYVLQDAQLKASETLFIDDNLDNVLAAQSIGIQVIHHELGNEIVERLEDF